MQKRKKMKSALIPWRPKCSNITIQFNALKTHLMGHHLIESVSNCSAKKHHALHICALLRVRKELILPHKRHDHMCSISDPSAYNMHAISKQLSLKSLMQIQEWKLNLAENQMSSESKTCTKSLNSWVMGKNTSWDQWQYYAELQIHLKIMLAFKRSRVDYNSDQDGFHSVCTSCMLAAPWKLALPAPTVPLLFSSVLEGKSFRVGPKLKKGKTRMGSSDHQIPTCRLTSSVSRQRETSDAWGEEKSKQVSPHTHKNRRDTRCSPHATPIQVAIC